MTIDISSVDLNSMTWDQLLQIARANEAEVVELKDNILKPADIRQRKGRDSIAGSK